MSKSMSDIAKLRIGHGYDVHRFGEGDHITLGGVTIPYERGLIAHSDGDVVLHALCDALLGACALGDIGQHFPDSDDAFKDADSIKLLSKVIGLVNQHGYCFGNADITIVAQAPRMAPLIDTMRNNIATCLEVSPNDVSVKATTTERLGCIGKKEGIAVHAVVLVRSTH